ncbi:MAG: hypothetical protein HY399_08695 [Elusimicrobia bacterium]|nr:hypothetical protein [Elusimicrobiota bacterium]
MKIKAIWVWVGLLVCSNVAWAGGPKLVRVQTWDHKIISQGITTRFIRFAFVTNQSFDKAGSRGDLIILGEEDSDYQTLGEDSKMIERMKIRIPVNWMEDLLEAAPVTAKGQSGMFQRIDTEKNKLVPIKPLAMGAYADQFGGKWQVVLHNQGDSIQFLRGNDYELYPMFYGYEVSTLAGLIYRVKVIRNEQDLVGTKGQTSSTMSPEQKDRANSALERARRAARDLPKQ